MKTRISFAFLVIFLVSSLMVHSQEDTQKITLEDIYKKHEFRDKTVSGLRSMDDGIHYTVLEGNAHIIKYSYETGKEVDTVFSAESHDAISSFSRYEFSEGENKIMLATRVNPIYRRSFTARFYVFNRKDETLQPVSEKGAQRLATFSPDGSRVGFVRDNDLYIKNLDTGRERQITHDGRKNHIINGTTDWVYEEEFAITQGFRWSPDGDKIAFYKFDESRVRVFHMTMFQGRLYPEDYAFKYPKAGEKNSIVKIFVHNLEEDSTREMDTGEETDQYLPRFKWTPDNNELCMIRMNRLQNEIEIMLANATTGESRVVYQETNPYYISQIGDDYPTFVNDGEQFIIYSEKSGYNHLYLYNKNGELASQITSGEWDVTEFIGYDPQQERVFYTAAQESPLRRHVYSIASDGTDKRQITQNKGWNNAEFSKGYKYFINYHSTANTPPVITLHNRSGELIRTLEDNARLEKKTEQYGFTEKEFIKINTPSSEYDLNAYTIKPPNFDPNKAYPLFMYLYGGPGSQTVTDQWSSRMAWFQMLAQRGYVIAVVDNRGTGARGQHFKKMTYGKLGKYETIDQIEAAQYFAQKPYIDSSRIGIFGWSYGGYMSSNCLFQGNETFSMAIAVAPVTNWRYYDTIYTERFMGLPQNNGEGYDSNSPINHVDGLKGEYLLIHGTGDDNVHVQNSMELAEELVQANKQFEMQFYPDKNHGIYGGNTTFHLYTRMTHFIMENL